MRIEVQQQDIDCGVKEDGSSCAIAQAIARILGTRNIEVCDANYIKIDGTRYTAPYVINRFIEAFDSGSPVDTIEFELEEYESTLGPGWDPYRPAKLGRV